MPSRILTSLLPAILTLITVRSSAALEVEGFDRPITVALRFPVSGGLMNQHYSQLVGFVIALSLPVDHIIMPCSYARAMYSKDPKAQDFQPFPHKQLYNMDKISLYVAGRGVQLTPGPVVPLTELLHTPKLPQGAVEEQVIYLPDIYTKVASLEHLVAEINSVMTNHVRQHAPLLLSLGHPAEPVIIFPTFKLPVLMGINLSQQPMGVEVAKHLEFAHEFYELAYRIISNMRRRSGSRYFNGVHLRVEEDARIWHKLFGDEAAYWDHYHKGARELDFGKMPLYVASGAWETKNTTLADIVDAWTRKYSTMVFHKGMVLPFETLESLNSEQIALIELLVLVRCQKFLGMIYSTFSVFIREFRAVEGLTRSTTKMVGETGFFLNEDNRRMMNGTMLAA